MFRLPTHLESLVPPPRDQVPQSSPWRGSIVLPASSPHPAARPREIRVTAAEIENDNSQQEIWPKHFQLHVIRRRGVLREVQAWLAQVQRGGQLARCMLMPDRLPEQAASRENQALFESFAAQLLEEEIVALAPWSVSEQLPGGIILYPTSTTRALLVGAVLLNSSFPDFLLGSASPNALMGVAPHNPSASEAQNMAILNRTQPFQPSPFDPAPPNIASSSRYPATGSGYDASRSRSGRSSG
ncbi:hypothetical protein K466DRAFT_552019 [Polyporus arcularius HHB13444]|uniref:Uncharacterized protein n=1 Tax=Polyporus arcularius HHB13444 TaxID=1314778 RepID=A0A5C3P7J7_9APHY|nr:hypothetical protein K466DRAFT_552019 [Polyporus arcularius HHB13444]